MKENEKCIYRRTYSCFVLTAKEIVNEAFDQAGFSSSQISYHKNFV